LVDDTRAELSAIIGELKEIKMQSLFLVMVEWLNGKTAVIDQVSGILSLEFNRHGEIKIIHTPDEIGRNTPEYRKWADYLRGEYVSDVTMREDLVDIAIELGFSL
jgi:hypothetical protein